MLLTHGFADNATTWDATFPRLAEHFDVTRWDLRGHGRSAAPIDPLAYSPAVALADLESTATELGPRAVLVGHSLGGFLSLKLALQHPHRVRSLVMVASGPGFRDPDARAKFNAVIDRMAGAMPAPVAPLAHHDDDWVMRHLDRLACPLLIIVGERDTRFHAGADYLGRVVPTSTTVVVPGAGHHPQRDDPNAVVEAILAHLGS